MKKILITGGSGTVGSAFIKEFYNQYQFVSYGRNEEKQAALKSTFNNIELVMGSIENKDELINTFLTIKPDIVIHTAALKYIDIAEKQPSQAIKVNLLGSMNIIEASKIANVPITIGVSSDKACLSNSVYGHTKNLMERIFLEANNDKNKFICCRFCNVAGSEGSVISRWLALKKENQPLKITDPKMNRFIFLPKDAAHLLEKAITLSFKDNFGGILLKKVKAVNMHDLAFCISPHIEIMGKRPGERLDETLITIDEIPYTYMDKEYVLIQPEKNPIEKNRISESLYTASAEKMNTTELKNLIKNCGN